MKKILYILIDGVADRPTAKLDGLTPLQAAKTPNLDAIASDSVMGNVVTVGEGIAPESDIAVFSMLGYRFEEGYVGRGVVEAIGSGLEFHTGEVALRANFATADQSLNLIDRRAGRNLTDEEAKSLAEEINSKVRFKDPSASFTFRHTVGHRGVLVIRHKINLKAEITNTDPAYVRMGGMGMAKVGESSNKVEKCVPLVSDPGAEKAAELVNEFTNLSYEILSKSTVNRIREERGFKPANIILLRDAGDKYPELMSLEEKYGKSFAAIVDMPVEIGISKLVGFSVFQSSKDDYVGKVNLTLKALDRYEVVYLHLKGPDEYGHDGMAKEKKESIERIDSEYFGPLMKDLKEDTVVSVSADHATPCDLKSHSDDPVPLMISNSSLGRDGSSRFTEEDAAKGSLGRLNGTQVLSKVLSSAY